MMPLIARSVNLNVPAFLCHGRKHLTQICTGLGRNALLQ